MKGKLYDVPGYSREILSSIQWQEIVTLSKVKTLNDFKPLQLCRIFDLNFTPSLHVLLERGYFEQISEILPNR